MEIYEYQYKLKPGADRNEGLRIFNELAVPIYRKIPGCISAIVFEYKPIPGPNPIKYDYVFFEVWESKEAHEKAFSDKYIGIGEDSELAKTGFYEKIGQMIEEYSHALGTSLAST